ncbi:peptidylprolyl isomerase [Moraxella sp.]|uniref:peptidylprolyl isomerase n=1 Tax=Moraxella sp. TaxID=479 RepID=UPI0026DAF0F4|nr:peptidylprolyl isomerase [Moraxella sp.]MDO4895213.1 peptidylprolyl isomerase [Moraxella sp.]
MKTTFKQTLLALALAGSVLTAQASISGSSTDGIVAVVNDEIILKSELETARAIIAAQASEKGIQASQAQITQKALDELIARKLQLALVNRAGMVANDNIINEQILQIAQAQGINTLSEFQAKLDGEKAGSYAALRQSVIENAALSAMWQNQISNRIHISSQEIASFLNSPEAKQIISQEQVLIPEWQTSHILARVDDTQSAAMAEQKINALYAELQKGANFASLAATYSDDPGSASQYGSLGWVNEGQMVPEFEAMMKKTSSGDFSTPFRSQFGWHILKVDNTRQRDITAQYRQNAAREYLFARQAPQAEEDWLQELRSGAYIKIYE